MATRARRKRPPDDGRMVAPLATVPFVAVLLASGRWANRRYARFDELPGHYDIRGEATRMAPRAQMAWLMPVVSSIVLVAIAIAPPSYSVGGPQGGLTRRRRPWRLRGAGRAGSRPVANGALGAATGLARKRTAPPGGKNRTRPLLAPPFRWGRTNDAQGLLADLSAATPRVADRMHASANFFQKLSNRPSNSRSARSAPWRDRCRIRVRDRGSAARGTHRRPIRRASPDAP